MAIPLPRRRNNPMRRPNTGQVPTRSNIQRQNVSKDPGARGGPTSIPTNAFTGGSQGIIDLGTGIQQVADAESAQLQQELNRSDYINTEIEKGNLANDIDKIANNFDAISGSYRNTDGSVDKDGMNKVDQLIEQASQNRLNIVQNNRSMSQRASDEFSMQAELVKQNAYAKLRKNVATARTEQFKLSLQAQLVQVAAASDKDGRTVASDVVNLIIANRQIANGFISSLNTKARNEALSTANAGLLKDAVRKFVLGGQFGQAKTRIYQIVDALGQKNISTTGWTAKSINEAHQYIDEEQQKFNATQQSSKLSEFQGKIAELKKLNLPEDRFKEVVIGMLGGPKPEPVPDKIKVYNFLKDEFKTIKNPTAKQYTDFHNQKIKLLSGLDPDTDTKTDLEIKIDSVENRYPMPRTEEDEAKYLEEIRAVTTGIKPKDAPADSDTDKKQDRLDKMLADKKISSAVWVDATLSLNSGLKPPAPAPATVAQERAIKYLNKMLKEKKITQPEYDRRMMQVHNFIGQEKFPELDEDLKPENYRLISAIADTRLGAKAIAAGTLQPKEGYEEFSVKFKEAIVDAYVTGVYPNGSQVTGERNLFRITDRISKMAGYKENLPELIRPTERFDKRVGIELTGSGKDIGMKIVDPVFENITNETASDIIEETERYVSGDYLKNRFMSAATGEGALTVEKATGIWSAIQDSVAQFSQFLGDRSEDPQVTQSRLLYSLIARDFIRFVSLSPRFAVKEQELLRDLFPSSGVLNSPRQTHSRLKLFRNLLKKKIVDLRTTAQYNPDQSEEAIETAKVWANTVRNINTLIPEIPSVDTLVDLKKLSPSQAHDYIKTEILGDKERDLTMEDFNNWRPDVLDQYGPKKGGARMKVLFSKIQEYARIREMKRRK